MKDFLIFVLVVTGFSFGAHAQNRNAEKDLLIPFVKLVNGRPSESRGESDKYVVAIEVVDALPGDVDMQTKLDLKGTESRLTLQIARKAVNDPFRYARGLLDLEDFNERGSFSAMDLELNANSEAGSLSSRAALLQRTANGLSHQELSTLAIGWISAFLFKDPVEGEKFNYSKDAVGKALTARLRKDSAAIRAQAAEVTRVAVADLRKRQAALDQWRRESGTLEKLEAQSLKLNDLIVRNDRAGVRRMIDAYLPWAVMEPAEINAWKVWLEAIEHPDPQHQTVAFRGVSYDTDFVQSLDLPDGRRNLGFMSCLLTKNQGSYTRRLRSLSTKRLQNGVLLDSPKAPVLMTLQMSKHAQQPTGSIFLSFSYDPEVIMSFVDAPKRQEIKGNIVHQPRGGMLAVRMDSRRLVPNVGISVASEVELLAPLIIFPDEVLVYQEYKGAATDYGEFLTKVSKITGVKYDGGYVHQMHEPWVKDGLRFLEQITHPLRNGGAHANSCDTVWN